MHGTGLGLPYRASVREPCNVKGYDLLSISREMCRKLVNYTLFYYKGERILIVELCHVIRSLLTSICDHAATYTRTVRLDSDPGRCPTGRSASRDAGSISAVISMEFLLTVDYFRYNIRSNGAELELVVQQSCRMIR